jgi:hypothetical protein
LVNTNDLIEVAGLDIDDGSGRPTPFAAYESESPPPPKLESKGIITIDITAQFTNAAQSVSSLDNIYAITC